MFIVKNSLGALCLHRYWKDDPLVLVWGEEITVFRLRSDARNAIKRSRRYAKKHGHPWDTDYVIYSGWINGVE